MPGVNEDQTSENPPAWVVDLIMLINHLPRSAISYKRLRFACSPREAQELELWGNSQQGWSTLMLRGIPLVVEDMPLETDPIIKFVFPRPA